MKNNPVIAYPPLLCPAKEAARLVGISIAAFYSADSRGGLPKAVKISGNSKRLWSYRHLELWATRGCPARDSKAWQAILAKMREVQS